MWNREIFAALVRPPVIGMVHLPPLPGAPGCRSVWEDVTAVAFRDADALVAGGVGAIMVENYGDVPFYPDRVPPATVAAMTAVTTAIRNRHPDLPLGVNVLRNDAEAALATARVTGASFVRVNVHAGAAVTDQGVLTGRAHQTLRLRRELEAEVGILADVRVKHARPLGDHPLEEEALDLRWRALADGIIVTGPATGSAVDPYEMDAVRTVLPDCPLLAGSGVNSVNVAQYSNAADGFIVGSALKGADGAIAAEKVAEFITSLQAATRSARGKDTE